MTSWKLSAGSDAAGSLTDVFTSEITLGSSMQEFLVDIDAAHNVYRLTALSVEGDGLLTGLSYFQIYLKTFYTYAR